MSPRYEVEVKPELSDTLVRLVESAGGKINYLGPTRQEFADLWRAQVQPVRVRIGTLLDDNLDEDHTKIINGGLKVLFTLDQTNLTPGFDWTRFRQTVGQAINSLLPDDPPDGINPLDIPRGLKISTRSGRKHLVPNEAIILIERFGLDGIERTLREIADSHNVDVTSVHRYSQKAEGKIRRHPLIHLFLREQ